MSVITDDRLDHWFKTNQNVLLSGKHGVGKTARIQSCFERNGLVQNDTYLYFSASTLDPWVDLIGVPKEQLDQDGNKYLGIIRPQNLYKGNVVAIFFDEYNRSPKKVRNAVMELIQKKSINGLVFPNLKCVWAAVNPSTEDDVYDVEKIDPAQEDRFQVQVALPYSCDRDFFTNRFTEPTASAAIEWWNDLPEQEKNKVSPRRLQYALDDYVNGGDMEFILPVSSNVNKLRQALKHGSVENKLKEFFSSKDEKKIKAWFSSENNCNGAIKYILGDKEYFSFFLPFVNKEKLMALMSTNDKVLEFMLRNRDQEDYKRILQNVMVGTNETLKHKITRLSNKIKSEKPSDPKEPAIRYVPGDEVEPFKPLTHSSHFSTNHREGHDEILRIHGMPKDTIEDKTVLFDQIKYFITDDIPDSMAGALLNVIQMDIVAGSSKSTLKSRHFHDLPSVIKFLASRCPSKRWAFRREYDVMAKLLNEYGIYNMESDMDP